MISILHKPSGLSSYYHEILKSFGIFSSCEIDPEDLPGLDPKRSPILICPTGSSDHANAIIAYAEKGGTVICSLPKGDLAKAAGLVEKEAKSVPLRLRVNALLVPGLAGEELPIVGNAITYETESTTEIRAHLTHQGNYQGESAGITETTGEPGRIVAFAFDPALAVLHLRQGDPERAELIMEGVACARPSNIAVDFGPYDSTWIPHADLLCQVLVGLIHRLNPFPVPAIWHLPGRSKGILLYSGDEDWAEVAWNDEEMNEVTRQGGRMNLYIIPSRTESTQSDVERYRENHDIGPHPNLRPYDGFPIEERLKALEDEILLFEKMFGCKARSLRNHCTAWAGYLEPIELLERLGVEMDSNYFSGCYGRARVSGPYSGFGAAIPMRFCRPDGRLISVFQQHTHLSDDVLFGPADYSLKISAESFDGIINRMYTDIVTRFHSPYTVNIHPTNYVKYSGLQGRSLMEKAHQFGLPIWSFDQWLDFWKARDALCIESVDWDDGQLSISISGERRREDLNLEFPADHAKGQFISAEVNGEPAQVTDETVYQRGSKFIRIPIGRNRLTISTRYQ